MFSNFYILLPNIYFSLNINTKHAINKQKMHLRILFNHNITLFTILFDLNTKCFLIKFLTCSIKYNSLNLQSLNIYEAYMDIIKN